MTSAWISASLAYWPPWGSPIVAGGNSNGDIPMLHYTRGPARYGFRLLLLHDDPVREFDYTAGAEPVA